MSNERRQSGKLTDNSQDQEIERIDLSFSFGESRPRSDGMLAGSQPAIDDVDLAAVRDTLLKFENLPARDLVASHGTITTDPYTAVSGGLSKVIDLPAITNWANSADFQAANVKYDGNNNSVSLVKLSTTLIDDNTASSHYTIEDKQSDGSVEYARAAAMLVRENGVWKIAVHSQHPIDL